MNFNRDKLLFCLNTVKSALPTKSTIPVLENIYFKCEGNEAQFTAYNLEMEIICAMSIDSEINSEDEINLLLPSKVIDIIRYLPEDQVEVIVDKYNINISSGQAEYRLFGANTAEYPTLLEGFEGIECVLIPQKTLKQALQQVVFAASTNIGRPVFNGVLVTFEERGLTLTASDTYRVAIASVPVTECPIKNNVLIPSKTAKELMRLLNNSEKAVTVGIHKNQVIFCFENIVLTALLLDEQFPDVSGIFPSNPQTKLKLSRKEFGDVVARALLLATGENKAISFVLDKDGLKVSVSSETGTMEEVLPVERQGEGVEVYLNSQFLLDMVKAVGYETLSAEFNGPTGPVMFRPAEEDGYSYLVLPIKMGG